ncbi:hypothetical protein EWM64_g4998 [Hericium alpestre]|uniref:Uncharacterized protein n=1 Tax=Hericium alpestre TaxID=135208 RepID=A0A4Y9ZY95_9AGAM|nr:hypothetical protein EWM64_g4998 [Hericium alpestre]
MEATNRPTKSQSEKTAEFARLFYFFEKLSQPRPRLEVPSSSDATTESWVPKDMEPLLKNLRSVLAKDAPVEDEPEIDEPSTPTPAAPSPSPSIPVPPSTPRPRRNTLATPTIPKRYPFTFKMMLHKLYDLEDWAAKVREVVSTSQAQFRSLEEGARASDGPATPRSPPVTFSKSFSPLASPVGKSDCLPSASPAKDKFKDMTYCRPARSVGTQGARENGWVYNATASSFDMDSEMERRQVSRDMEERRKRVISSVGFEEMEKETVAAGAARVHFVERRPMKRLNGNMA